ncbi:predicted protein [Chaetoceros tenuissimus]|uniref:RING-type domain-containing protein n=1 Tax=Chaetoceros tenuissimus TaxID=426638 RepID=A0AAD3DAN5_9STRA|nr:predicted protein [Chaetoceros tenuissimus]
MKRGAMIVLILVNCISAMNSFPFHVISEERKSTFPFSATVEACPDIFDQPKDLYAYHPICDPEQILTQIDHDELTQTLEKFSQETLIDLSVVLTTSSLNTDEGLTNITMNSSEEENQPFFTPQANASLLGKKRIYQSILILINIEDISMIASASKSLRKAISHLEDYIHLGYFSDDFHLVRDEIAGSLHFVILDNSLSSRHLNEQTDKDAERTTKRINEKLFFWRHLDGEIIKLSLLLLLLFFLRLRLWSLLQNSLQTFSIPTQMLIKQDLNQILCMRGFKERIGSDNQSLKILSCGHSLDRSCWRLYKQANATNKDSCPICRQRLNSSASSLSSSSMRSSLSSSTISYSLPHYVSILDSSENDDANLPHTNLNGHNVLSYSDEEEANFAHQNRYQDAWEDQILANIRTARNQPSYGSTAIGTAYGTNTRDHQNPLSPPLPLHSVYHRGNGLDSRSQQAQMFPIGNHGQYDNNIHHMATTLRLQTAFSSDQPNQRRVRRERQNQIYINNSSFMRQDRIAPQRFQEYSRSRERRNRRIRNVAHHVQDESSLRGLVVESPRVEPNQNNRASSGRRSRRTTHHGRTTALNSDYNDPSTSYISEYQFNRARRDRRSRRNRNNDRSTSHHFETEFSLIRNGLDPDPRHNRQR